MQTAERGSALALILKLLERIGPAIYSHFFIYRTPKQSSQQDAAAPGNYNLLSLVCAFRRPAELHACVLVNAIIHGYAAAYSCTGIGYDLIIEEHKYLKGSSSLHHH